MKCNRRTIRLNGFDYSKNGYYFVTICCHNKLNLFWNNKNIINNRADTSVRPYIKSDQNICPYINSKNLNNIGLMINFWLNEIPNHFKNVVIDEYIVMPDHIHFILIINNYLGHTKNENKNYIVGVDRCVDPIKLGNIIQWFKTMVTNEYIKNMQIKNWPKFDKRIFQRNYYDRIIRNENEFLRIKKYIKDNPLK